MPGRYPRIVRYDLVIAGAGLAGACAAFHLAAERSVLVVDAGTPGRAASGAAAGLVNPFLGRKAKPTWRLDDALGRLHATLAEAGASPLFRPTGVLRPATSTAQAGAFRSTAEAHARQLAWWADEEARERYPDVVAPHGALWIPEGGAVEIPRMVEALLAAARRRGAEVRHPVRLAGWEEGFDGCIAITDRGERIETRRLLLALGDGFTAFPALGTLPLHRIKGQTVRVARPPALPPDLPALSGEGYVVPAPDGLILGATFEHEFSDLAPSRAQRERLRERAALLLPALAEVAVLEEQAGVRVTVPRVRLPLLGPLPGSERVWVFTGLGAKGLLTAPLLSHYLSDWLGAPERIPPEISTRRLA